MNRPPIARPPARQTTRAPTRRRLLTGLLTACGGLVGAGCQWLPRQALVPMPTQSLAGPCGGRAPVLVVLLPGAYSLPGEFISEGFVDALRLSGRASAASTGPAVDLLLADAHLGYVRNRSLFDRLHVDIVQPARAQGYRQIWLVGISLGGFAALAYAAQHPGQVSGVLALAPYLGPPELLQQIEAAGGAAAWRRQRPPVMPAGHPLPPSSPEEALWLAWAAPAIGWPPFWEAPMVKLPPLYLGYGLDDRLRQGHRLLAATLPADRVMTVAGGHDWPPWLALWRQWLARGLLPATCTATSQRDALTRSG